jgi:hypothetical protein
MVNEDLLVAKAFGRPMLGWGGWGRNRVYDEEGHDLSVTDGMWVIIFGVSGLVGLVAWISTLLLPAWMTLKHCARRNSWTDPSNAVLQFAAVVLGLHAIDCLANAMPNPIYYLFAGGLYSVMSLDSVRRPRAFSETGPRTSGALTTANSPQSQ